ncbi:MAG: ATP-binding cassette domain-containing protein [Bdellovibrionaceae bacterium]|nr:ATP-binding cassette domain-containing protein [Bdellovibrionales bacterium]MCB9083010.1 ATP-binding cassette domain-containing protein [Pseudobdellovibrionaceae bacterium]
MAEVLLQVHNGGKSFGARSLFAGASFAANVGEHIGVIGPNGAGKSTLFRCLVGLDHLDSGDVIQSSSLRLGYLAQEDDFVPEETVEDYLGKNSLTPIWELKSLGKKLGLSEKHFSSVLTELSGGYRMRCKLLALIGQQPNLLLLDEPTNYLDLESLFVLESFLQDFKGAFLLISHDREFLRRTTDHILEIEGGEFTKFNGNIDDYFEQKALIREQLEKQALSQESKRSEILKFAAKFGAKATKARQVQSRLKQLDRMESIELSPLQVKAKIQIPPPVHTGKVVLEAIDLQLGYGDQPVLSDVQLSIGRQDHIGIVGINGAGKSTLLKGFAQKLPPQSGQAKLGYNVDVGYYAQHVAEELNAEDTVYEAMMRKAHSDVLPQEVKDLAGSLLFSGEDINKKVAVLSGGEKARVSLGQILLKKSPLLILDEPTNHLDFHTVEALTQALHFYPGSLVVVSHDRGFIKRIATKIIEIRDGHASLYPGTYDEYVWSQQKGVMGLVGTERSQDAPSTGESSAESSKVNTKERRKELDRQIKSQEKRCLEINREIKSLEAKTLELNEKLMTESGDQAQRLAKELGDIQGRNTQLEEEWFELQDTIESAKTEIESLRGGKDPSIS